MNVIWIVADTFRWDHLGAYGNKTIHTPALDSLAARATRFDRHYAAAFPTVPARADHHTGRWTMSFMGWEPLPPDAVTLAQLLAQTGFVTVTAVDTPFDIREEMNFDRGFQAFFFNPSQDASLVSNKVKHESWDIRASWRHESDRAAPQTFDSAMRWLERHYKEDFFLYIDTWDPHEPWDAPSYYTELYLPGYDGEIIDPPYARWQEVPGLTLEKVKKAHETYCGEITMVDTWVGHLLRLIENMGLMDKTAIIFTTDHGFLFGEDGGHFGKSVYVSDSGDAASGWNVPGVGWSHDPLYEEIIHIPLLVYVPGVEAGVYNKLTSAVDVMPTVLDILGQDIPEFVEGESLLSKIHDASLPGREFVISGKPFNNPGEPVKYVDNILRRAKVHAVSTLTTPDWSLLYAVEQGKSELYNLASDPGQETNVILDHQDVARDLHQYIVKFMRDTNVPSRLLEPRLQLKP